MIRPALAVRCLVGGGGGTGGGVGKGDFPKAVTAEDINERGPMGMGHLRRGRRTRV